MHQIVVAFGCNNHFVGNNFIETPLPSIKELPKQIRLLQSSVLLKIKRKSIIAAI